MFVWGDGEAKSSTLRPGASRFHSYKLFHDGTAPTPGIAFETGEGAAVKTYDLKFWTVTRPSRNGKPYDFLPNTRRFLDLFEPD
jgi:hypothetical protein